MKKCIFISDYHEKYVLFLTRETFSESITFLKKMSQTLNTV